MFLCRPTHGKVLAGSTSFASQTTTAAGRHIMSNPVRPSERYESAAVSANSLNQAHTRALAIREHSRRRAVRGAQQTGVWGHLARLVSLARIAWLRPWHADSPSEISSAPLVPPTSVSKQRGTRESYEPRSTPYRWQAGM